MASVEGSAANLELKGMASAPHEATLFNAPRFSQLPAMVDSIVSATCDGAYVHAYWLYVIVEFVNEMLEENAVALYLYVR